ncbi:rhomboid family intramembrane serine protease [Candidatus Woesearchaeota archaeon]|nr:rhomboid family intramembrane serine protease [Candidatus Woesearchaeota archaeon]MBW3022173.1 rhomboid family intramembrane serine protease [Candidatus Woesearchaeota archaeon]
MHGEIWRLFTFPFTHTSVGHLIENMGALIVTSLFAYLVGIKKKEFLTVFIGASLLLALTDVLLFPTMVIAGTSLGIFAVLGSVSSKGTKFIPHHLLIPVLLSAVFFKYLINVVTTQAWTGLVLNQTLLHFFGFVSGMLLFYILGTSKIRKRVLSECKE